MNKKDLLSKIKEIQNLLDDLTFKIENKSRNKYDDVVNLLEEYGFDVDTWYQGSICECYRRETLEDVFYLNFATGQLKHKSNVYTNKSQMVTIKFDKIEELLQKLTIDLE